LADLKLRKETLRIFNWWWPVEITPVATVCVMLLIFMALWILTTKLLRSREPTTNRNDHGVLQHTANHAILQHSKYRALK